MYLKAVNIRNFRTIASLDLQLAPGLNVLFGANETGKSTFLEALHAAFFVNADSAKTDVNKYRPWESQADPSVKIVFDANGKEFEIEKVYVGAKKGRLASKATGLDTSNKDRINEELAKLMPLYSSDGRSLRNTFWIAQGELENTAAKLSADSNLRSALQHIMFRSDGNLEEIKKSIKKTITEYKKGLEHLAKSLGPVAQAKKEVDRLAAEVDEFRTQLASFERNMTQQKDLQDRVNKLQARIVEDGDVLQAFDKYRQAKKNLDDANAALDALQEEIESYQSSERRIDEINKKIAVLQGDQEKCALSLFLLQKTEERDVIIAKAKEEQSLIDAVGKLDQQLAALTKEQAKYTSVTKRDLEAARQILNDIEVKKGSLKASQLTVESTGLSHVNMRIAEDEKEARDESLSVRESKTFRANQKLRITIPAVIEFTITSGESNAEAIQKKLNDAEHLLSAMLSSHGVKTFEELSKQFDEQQKLASSLALLETERKAKLNARSMDQLEQSSAALLEKGRILSSEIGDYVPRHGESVDSLQGKNNQLVEELAHLTAEVRLLDQAKGKFLGKFGAPDKASEKRKELAREAAKAEAALEGIPKMELEDDKVFTLKKNLDSNRIEYSRTRDELLKIAGAVQSSSVSSDQLHLKEAELSDAKATYESNLIEYEALKILDGTLAEAEANVSAHLMQPIEEHVKPMLPQLTASRYSRISLNEGLEIESVGYKHLEVKPDDLSTGTQGQIALALRLALIKHLSGNDRQLVIIDDALVNFDAERLKEGKKLLAEFAKTHQVMYLTCHAELKKWSDAEVFDLA